MRNELIFFNIGKLEQNRNLFKFVINNEFGIYENDLESIVSGYKFLFNSETGGYIEVKFIDNSCQLITIINGDFAEEVIEVYKAFANRFQDNDSEIQADNSENGLKVYYDGDCNWYATPWNLDKTLEWVEEVTGISSEELELEEMDLDNEGMWYETTEKKDYEALGEYKEKYFGGIGDLRRSIEDEKNIDKFTSFREVIRKQGTTEKPYIIATTEY